MCRNTSGVSHNELGHHKAMFENKNRPAWLNWVFLAIFLWSSWQLAVGWYAKLNG
ncbi:hypothetical protein SynA1825c_01494 [Synechococcus sp. A18-25c]|nr:hypothetical protein SynA1825c_01494 [Synechococcus sp. A18-25c]